MELAKLEDPAQRKEERGGRDDELIDGRLAASASTGPEREEHAR